MEFDKEISYNGCSYVVMGTCTKRWIDESFSHEFGIEERGHWAVENFDVECISLLTEEGPADLDWNTLRKELKYALTYEIMQIEVCA